MEIPKVGQEIWIPSALYLGHGEDDVMGGKTTITGVVRNDALPFEHFNSIFVKVKAIGQSTSYNYRSLLERQDELKEKFGDNIAYPDPDDREEFNKGW